MRGVVPKSEVAGRSLVARCKVFLRGVGVVDEVEPSGSCRKEREGTNDHVKSD